MQFLYRAKIDGQRWLRDNMAVLHNTYKKASMAYRYYLKIKINVFFVSPFFIQINYLEIGLRKKKIKRLYIKRMHV